MIQSIDSFSDDFDPRFKTFHELMAWKVREILLVSTPYHAWIMEEDCRLSERIINEYRGLNLSHPPRLTWVSSAEKALDLLEGKAIAGTAPKRFDLVVTMPCLGDMDGFSLGREIKRRAPDLPVVLLSHSAVASAECRIRESAGRDGIDRTFVWTGNTDLLVALIKSVEDRRNAGHDTGAAGIRVILMVEDSPVFLSSLLPILYKELVSQTQAVMEEGLNQEHRLLTMRARPKILVAETYEEAVALFERYEPFILGVISDVRFPREGRMDGNAGVDFLSRIKSERFDIPALLVSAEPSNAQKAERIPAAFVDKNSPTLQAEVRSFVKEQLGFGDFVFRMPDGREIGRASNLKSLEKCLCTIPDASFVFHCNRNDISRWLFARTETVLASRVRPVTHNDFADVESHRRYLVDTIHARRRRRQKGVVVNFDPDHFDPDTEFFKVGQGSLGGKARGLAFMSHLLQVNTEIHRRFSDVSIQVPQALVVTTDGFESFVETNDLRRLAKADLPDDAIVEAFLAAELPIWVEERLMAYLTKINYPLAVRSSSLLEDAQFSAYAGLYRTCMIPNAHPDLNVRLRQLAQAVKLVYASTYFQGPKAFSRRVGHRTEEEQMAVIIQRLIGSRYGDVFYPAISGVAQSCNFYPFSIMQPADGIASIALGLGKTVMQGEQSLRFSPKHPNLLPERSSVEDYLKHAQRHFYALKMDLLPGLPSAGEDQNLERRSVADAVDDMPVRMLAGTYYAQEHRIRESLSDEGSPVLTFARVLKYDGFPLAELLAEALKLGQDEMGCPVEIEFSVDFHSHPKARPEFTFLQIRPMNARAESGIIHISEQEIAAALCVSHHSLGNADRDDLSDIVFVRPDAFDPAMTPEIALEISRMNTELIAAGRHYVLVGPGRWGSADRWLGIPVTWRDISGVGTIVETFAAGLAAEPSQGSHFLHNIITMGINYITVVKNSEDFFDWNRLASMPVEQRGRFVAHVRHHRPIVMKVDGRRSLSVMVVDS